MEAGEAYKCHEWLEQWLEPSAPAMALATFLLFLSSVSAQTIYDIVSQQFFSTSLKCGFIQNWFSAIVANDLGPQHAVHEVLFFLVLCTIIVLLTVP